MGIQASAKPSWAGIGNGGAAATPRSSSNGAPPRPMSSGGTPSFVQILVGLSHRTAAFVAFVWLVQTKCSIFVVLNDANSVFLSHSSCDVIAGEAMSGMKRPGNGTGTPMPTTPMSAMQRSLQSRPLASSALGAQLSNGIARPSLFGSTPRPISGDINRQRPK